MVPRRGGGKGESGDPQSSTDGADADADADAHADTAALSHHLQAELRGADPQLARMAHTARLGMRNAREAIVRKIRDRRQRTSAESLRRREKIADSRRSTDDGKGGDMRGRK